MSFDNWICIYLDRVHFTDDDNDDDKNRTIRLDRRRIRTPFCDDNAVQFAVSASSSEKAENSDIFTVSSDSYLDTDVNNDTVTTAKSGLSADSRLSAEDESSMSDETTINNESNWRYRSSLRKIIHEFYNFYINHCFLIFIYNFDVFLII